MKIKLFIVITAAAVFPKTGVYTKQCNGGAVIPIKNTYRMPCYMNPYPSPLGANGCPDVRNRVYYILKTGLTWYAIALKMNPKLSEIMEKDPYTANLRKSK